MCTRVIGLGVCLVPFLLAVASCGDDDGPTPPSERPCTPGEQSTPTNDPNTDPCPQNFEDMATGTSCKPYPQKQAITMCCTEAMKGTPGCPKVGFWRRSCQCFDMGGGPKAGTGVGMAGRGGGNNMCGDGVVQAGAPFFEDCDPGSATLGKPAIIGSSCAAMQMGSGLLMCDPMTCKYDTSMCTPAPGGGGTGGS